MTNLPLILYAIFFLIAVFAPLRWGIVGFILLATIDLGSTSASIGLLNTAKALILPVYMLWRFHDYAGHGKITAAPVAWSLLIVYVAIASCWSVFPMFAIKLIGHMIGSLVICMVLVRATKGGQLSQRTLIPVTLGTLTVSVLHWFLLHGWGGEPERFTTFAGAQACAAFFVALYCGAFFAKYLPSSVRIALCASMATSVVLNGSRLWIVGLCLITLLGVFVSQVELWVKVVTLGLTITSAVVIIGAFEPIMDEIAVRADSNRIAATITAAYQGNVRARGLATYNLRQELYHRTIENIESGALLEVLFGHGTCNGALIAAAFSNNPDPNRAMHNEWLRAIYEWGIPGLMLWLIFIGSLVIYAIEGVRQDRTGNSVPLLIYLPAFAIGLSGENFIAAAGNVASVGLLVLIAFASISHRNGQRMPRRKGQFARGRAAFGAMRLLPESFSVPLRFRSTP